MYKTESKKQSKINVLDLDIGELEKIDESCFKWTIDSTDRNFGDQTHTDYHFLYWGDIVKKYWFKSPLEIVKALGFLLSNLRLIIFYGIPLTIRSQPSKLIPYLVPMILVLCISMLQVYVIIFFCKIAYGYYIADSLLYFISYMLIALLSIKIISLIYSIIERYAILWLFRLYIFSFMYQIEVFFC